MIARKFLRDYRILLCATALALGAQVVSAQAPPAVNLPHGMPPGATGAGAAGVGAAAVNKPMVLTDSQVQSFFAAADDLQGLGGEASAFSKTNPSQPMAYAKGMQFSSEALAILNKHGFKDGADFQRVAYNAAMAYGVVEQGGKEALNKELDAGAQQQQEAMEQMRKHLSPEQMKMMQGQMGAGMAMAGSMRDVPDQNVELMTKYRAQMEALGNK